MRTLLRIGCCAGVYFVSGHNAVATLLAIVAAIAAASVPAPYAFPRPVRPATSFVRIDRSIGAEQIGIPDKLSMN
ncbi:MAG: hypothetical protein ACYCUI_07215 [Vulcanimicrobiaceae bacterium]